MANVTLRPTESSDWAQVASEPLPFRIRAMSAEVDGRVIGIGGLAFQPDGMVVAFVQLAADAKRYPVALHKAALATIDMAARLGLKRLYALCDSDIEAAERWLRRLGFVPLKIGDRTFADRDGRTVFQWQR